MKSFSLKWWKILKRVSKYSQVADVYMGSQAKEILFVSAALSDCQQLIVHSIKFWPD